MIPSANGLRLLESHKFDRLALQPADPLLALIGEFARDTRADKIDIGVGVYRDASGATTVFRAVKAAEQLDAEWRAELDTMQRRIAEVRETLAREEPALTPLRDGYGMFAMLPLTSDQVELMRARCGIYMPRSGRINLAGLEPTTIDPFLAAFRSIKDEERGESSHVNQVRHQIGVSK